MIMMTMIMLVIMMVKIMMTDNFFNDVDNEEVCEDANFLHDKDNTH